MFLFLPAVGSALTSAVISRAFSGGQRSAAEGQSSFDRSMQAMQAAGQQQTGGLVTLEELSKFLMSMRTAPPSNDPIMDAFLHGR